MRFVSHMARTPSQPSIPLIMHGAKLHPDTVYKIGLIHAATRKTKKVLAEEAYDLLIAKYEREGILEPSAAEIATRTLQGDQP